jgi:hypothetical protein
VCGSDQTCVDGGCATPTTTDDAGTTCDTTARAGFPAIATPNGVYLVEGIPVNTPSPLSTTTFIGLTANGALDPSKCMTPSTVTVPVAEYSIGVARIASSVYLLGGYANGSTQPNVYRAQVTTGALGAFSATNVNADGGAPVAFQQGRYADAIVQTTSYVYVIGGWAGTAPPGTDLSSIERAQVDPTTGDFVTNFEPAIDPATKGPATLAVPRGAMQIYRHDPWVYLMGGQTQSGSTTVIHDEIQRATIDAAGNLSSFTVIGTLPMPLSGATVFVGGGTVYLIAGATGFTAPSYALTDGVLAAPIAADGTLGTFINTLLQVPYAQCCGGSVTLGPTVYLLEGLTGNGFTATTSIESISLL